MKKIIFNLFFLFVLSTPLFVSAHEVNASYIYLKIYETDGIDGRFEIHIDEINKIFDLDFSEDVTADDLEPYKEMIQAYLLKHSSFSSKYGKHKVLFKDEIGVQDSEKLGVFAKFYFHLENSNKIPEKLDVFYDAVFEIDNTHRSFLVVAFHWKAGVMNNEAVVSLFFTPDKPSDTLSLNDDLSVWNGFIGMVRQGIWHIWIGLDHILFLIALILPSVLVRRREEDVKLTRKNFFGWEPVMAFKPAFFYILKIITFFTIAHTITLTLATLEVVSLPSRLVESIIAFSIGLAAYHNIKPIFKGKDWLIAFVFGLFHGFGFANVLADLGLTSKFLGLSLFGFNIGVELGQIVIIAVLFPILFLLRKKNIYKSIFLYGCIFLIIASIYWMVERIFDVSFGVEDQMYVWIGQIMRFLGLK